MIPQQQMQLTPENINRMLNQYRDNVSAIEGKMITMRTDNMSRLFEEFAITLNQFYKEGEDRKHEIKELTATLEQIYQGHPDIQIQIEAKAAEQKAEIEKKKVNVVKK